MKPRIRFATSNLLGIAWWAISQLTTQAVPTFSFVSASDTHYAYPDEKNDRERAILASVNNVPARSLGGIAVHSFRGVMNPGDLIDTGMSEQWSYWTHDFGLTGGDGAVLQYPVYEDFGGTGHDGAAMVGNITARNALRFGLTAYDGYNYSWDWNGVHFVTAGIKGGDTSADADRIFLTNDLATHVGNSGRPVVVMEHENDTFLVQSLYDEVLSNYNTILIVDGHQKGGAYAWNGIWTLSGNGFLAGYWLVQINGNTLKAGRTTGGSGNLGAALTLNINYPACVASMTDPPNGSWDRPALWSGGLTPKNNGDYASLDGTTPATLTLDGPRTLSGLNLDTTGSNGYTLVPGTTGSITLQKTAGAVSVSITGNHAITAPVTLLNDAAVWVGSNSLLEVSGAITGTDRRVAKAGAGTLVLAVSNSYTGTTTAAGGMLRLANSGALPGGIGATGGTSGLTFNGGMIELTDTDFLRPPGTGVYQVQFIGPGGFSCLGATGDRTVNLGGTGAQVTWGTGSFVPTGAALRLGSTSATLRFANPIHLGSATRSIEVLAGSARLDGGVLGTGGLTKSGTGTLILPKAATYTGTTTIAEGTLQLGADDVTGSANDFTLAGAITGAGTLVKTGSTTVTLNNANSHTGGTTVSGGSLRMGHAGALGFGAPVAKGDPLPNTTVNINATLDLNGKTLGGNFVLAGGSLVNNSASPATLESLAGLTTSNGGIAIPAGSSVSISGGGGSGATATPSFGLTNDSFVFSNIGRDYVTNDILYITGGGGSGACFRITALGDSSGVGTLSLVDPGSGYTSAPTDVVGGGSGRNATITGNAGNFQVASISLTAPGTGYTTAPTVSLSGGTGFAATAVLSSVVLTADGSLGGTGNLTIAAPITGGYGITKTGGGTATLTGSNSYSGDTTVAAGTLSLSSACLTDTADVKIASGTTLNLNTGTTDTIHKLFIDNVAQATGDWGSTTSNAEHKSPLITGSGKLHVTNGDVLPGQLTVVQWQSVNTHGGTPRGLVISDTGLGVEPRQGRINRLEITFSDPVLVGNPSTAVTVSGTNLTGPLTPASLGYTITATASGNVLAITFANGGTPVALPDTAKWRFTLNPAVITGTGGLTLTASPATTRVLTGLVGDVDGNGRVTGIDLNRISNAGTFNPTDENSLRADIDGNALIDSSDLNAAWANRAQRTDTLAAP